jgi:hypothetical protein
MVSIFGFIIAVMLGLNCDGFYRLDLGKRDQRMVAEMLVVLSIEEPGENVRGMCAQNSCIYFPSSSRGNRTRQPV